MHIAYKIDNGYNILYSGYPFIYNQLNFCRKSAQNMTVYKYARQIINEVYNIYCVIIKVFNDSYNTIHALMTWIKIKASVAKGPSLYFIIILRNLAEN